MGLFGGGNSSSTSTTVLDTTNNDKRLVIDGNGLGVSGDHTQVSTSTINNAIDLGSINAALDFATRSSGNTAAIFGDLLDSQNAVITSGLSSQNQLTGRTFDAVDSVLNSQNRATASVLGAFQTSTASLLDGFKSLLGVTLTLGNQSAAQVASNQELAAKLIDSGQATNESTITAVSNQIDSATSALSAGAKKTIQYGVLALVGVLIYKTVAR